MYIMYIYTVCIYYIYIYKPRTMPPPHGAGAQAAVTWVTGSLQTLHVLPQVGAAARTLIGTALLVGPPPVLTALTCGTREINLHRFSSINRSDLRE